MAIGQASCASGDSAPSDMPAESKRDRISSSGSTSSSGIGGPAGTVQQVAQRCDRPVVHQSRIVVVKLEVAAAHRGLQGC